MVPSPLERLRLPHTREAAKVPLPNDLAQVVNSLPFLLTPAQGLPKVTSHYASTMPVEGTVRFPTQVFALPASTTPKMPVTTVFSVAPPVFRVFMITSSLSFLLRQTSQSKLLAIGRRVRLLSSASSKRISLPLCLRACIQEAKGQSRCGPASTSPQRIPPPWSDPSSQAGDAFNERVPQTPVSRSNTRVP